MSEKWLISDTHFSHQGICVFLRDDGNPVRPWNYFEEMDEALIKNWNSVVGLHDRVYHLGDVGFNRNRLDWILPRLNGNKILIRGNHDKFKMSFYSKHFQDIRGSNILDKFILTHIPIHEESLGRWKGNIHGHLHYRELRDKRYINVSVERINYTPVHIDEVLKNV